LGRAGHLSLLQSRGSAARKNVSEAARLDPTGNYIMMSSAALLQALGRTKDAQDMVRKTRRLAPSEPLEFWVGLARGSSMPETMFKSYSEHLIDAWNATPEDRT